MDNIEEGNFTCILGSVGRSSTNTVRTFISVCWFIHSEVMSHLMETTYCIKEGLQ